LIHISRNNATYQCYSLDKDQYEVINHIKGVQIKEKRNILEESARIARGNVKNVKELDVSQYDVIL
jgi:enhancing lycopene biosynthesis protein 2